MNHKRQTVWLVSMLSLMVVLSAYYLFTSDVKTLDLAASGSSTPVEDVKVDVKDAGKPAGSSQTGDTHSHSTTGAANAPDAKSTGSAQATDAKSTGAANAPDAKSTGSAQATDAKATGSAQAPDAKAAGAKVTDEQSAKDAQTIKKLESQNSAASGADFFAAQQLKRSDELSKKTEQLLTVITDEKTTTEAMNKAYNDLQMIDQMEAKQTQIEESLAKEYGQAVLLSENGKWKVIVQADDMQKSQALSIVDQVMKEMNVGPEKVSVQHIH